MFDWGAAAERADGCITHLVRVGQAEPDVMPKGATLPEEDEDQCPAHAAQLGDVPPLRTLLEERSRAIALRAHRRSSPEEVGSRVGEHGRREGDNV